MRLQGLEQITISDRTDVDQNDTVVILRVTSAGYKAKVDKIVFNCKGKKRHALRLLYFIKN